MRPEDLIDAMSMISQDYVTEAKPAPKRHTESRNAKRDAAGAHESITVSRSNAASGKDYTVKKQSTIQRIMTGIATTAACAVFACGGWFIVRQARQQHDLESENQTSADSAVSGTDSTVDVQEVTRNFLGGQGEVRILDSSLSELGNVETVLYDDTRWYFQSARSYAERSSSETAVFRAMPAETGDLFDKMFYDGSRFYIAEDQCLYILNNDGTRSEQPFFGLTEQMISPDSAVSGYWFNSITRMTDTDWLIRMRSENSSFTAVYHADGTVHTLPEDIWYDLPAVCSDGSLLAALPGEAKYDGIDRIRTDGTVEEMTRFSGATNIVHHIAVYGDKLYVLLETYDDTGSEPYEYCELDLSTHAFRTLKNPDMGFSADPRLDCVFTNGQQEFLVKTLTESNRTVLYSADPDWENEQEIYRLDAFTEMPDEVRRRTGDADQSGFRFDRACADENYAVLSISGGQYAVCDLSTGAVQYFYADAAPSGSMNMNESESLHIDASLYNALDAGFTGTNFLGGEGSLYLPKDGSTVLLYDNTNFYMPAGCFPREGNTECKITEATDCAISYAIGRIFSDGAHLYLVQDGALNRVDNSGSLTPFFRLSDAGMDESTYFYKIFRVGNLYFFGGLSRDQGTSVYVWTDQDGKVLETKNDLPMNTEFCADTADGIAKYVYWYESTLAEQLRRIAVPGTDITAAEYTLPESNTSAGTVCSIIGAIDDRIIYSVQGTGLCAFEPDTGLHTILAASQSDETYYQSRYAIIGGKAYNMLTDPLSEIPGQTDIMEYDLETGHPQKILAFDKAALNQHEILNQCSNKLYFNTAEGLIWFDPQTGELFKLK
ncbi:MAG: hypothetical protein IKG82_03335 [Oscillospiraceae bacterium]|nr:hypothetical protein [Oscillospiraceae bacterium]